MAGAAAPAAFTQPRTATGPTAAQLYSPNMPDWNVNIAAAKGVFGAGESAMKEMGYAPQQVSAAQMQAPTIQGVSPITTQNVTAERLGGMNLSQYMNPFTSEVIGQTAADLERQRLIQQGDIGAQATAARAFGGSRQAGAESLTNEAFARQLAQTSAGLRQANFQQAQSAAQQDIASGLQAQLANQAAGLQAQTTTGQQALQAQLANQAAQQTAGQSNQQAAMQAALANQSASLAGSQQRLAAGAQLGNLANMGFGMGQTVTQNLAQQGAQQQALQQALLDAARGQFAGYSGAPAQSLQYLTSALGATPVPQTQTSTRNPGLFDYLTLAASGAAAFSDVRLKEKIKRVGNLTPEIGLYEWQWNDEAKRIGVGDQPTVGVIAQEVKDKIPGAVMLGGDGYFRVNYDKIAEAVR